MSTLFKTQFYLESTEYTTRAAEQYLRSHGWTKSAVSTWLSNGGCTSEDLETYDVEESASWLAAAVDQVANWDNGDTLDGEEWA